jgi:O-antigen ligase
VTSLAAVPSRPSAATAWSAAALLATAVLCGAFGLALDATKLTLAEVVGAGVGLMVVLGIALWRYKWAVSLAFLLLGYQIIDPAPVDLVLVVVIAVGFVTGRLVLRSVPTWVVVTMGAFIAMGMLSSTEAIKIGRAAFFLSITVYLCAFGLWVAAYVTTQERARTIVTCLVVVAVVSAIGGSLTLFMDVPIFNTIADGQRAEGLFDDPNIYGPFLVAVSLLLLQELIEPRLLRRWGRPLLALLTAIVSIGWFLSYSRAAWLNYGVALAVFLVLLPLRRGGATRALVLVLVVIAGAGTTVATVVLTGQSTFVQERAQKQSYDTDRFGAQRLGIEVAETRPLGIGPGQFEVVSPVSAHSTYIRAGAEQGFVGFVLVIVLFAGTLLVAINNVLWGKDTAGIGSLGLLAIWCGTLANSVFIDTLHWRHLFVFAGLIWSGSLAAPAISQASSRAGVRNPM